LLLDRVGQANQFQGPDGHPDAVFTVTLPAGGTVISLRLDSSYGGIWDTIVNGFWTLGVSETLGSALYNAANDSVNFVVPVGGAFKIYASEWFLDTTTFPNGLFRPGATFILTVGLSNGTTFTVNTTL